MSQHMIGQYEVLGVIGEGGMGQVLHAMDRKMGQEVALKVISPALLGSSSVAQRSQRELQALIALRGHPNVVTVYDYVPEPFAIVMEYLKGETLAQRIQAARGPLPASSIFPIAKAVLSALHYAHERGLLHRDVKPGNVMLVGYGTQEVVKVMDFGLAGFIGGGSTLTHTRTRMGTPAYMAPEQHLGRAADERTDIYAFGVMLFEMCTGRQPFPESLGSDYQIAQAHIERPIPSACGLNPSLPYGWDVLIGRCTQKEQTNRYANCGEVLADLERLRRGEPMGAQRAGAPQAPRWESGGGAQVRQPTAPTRLEQDLRESPSYGAGERRSKLPWIVTAVVLTGIALTVGALALTSGRKSQSVDGPKKDLKKVEERTESRGEKKGESVHVAGNALEPKKEEPKPAEPRPEPEPPRPEEPRPEEKPAEVVTCGPGQCGGPCGGCPEGQTCVSGRCQCQPKCVGRQCGDDGCGSVCGVCAGNTVCQSGQCICQRQCQGKNCGDDGCGGSCGSCTGTAFCRGGACVHPPKMDVVQPDRPFEYSPGRMASWICQNNEWDERYGDCLHNILQDARDGRIVLDPPGTCLSDGGGGTLLSFDIDADGTLEFMHHDVCQDELIWIIYRLGQRYTYNEVRRGAGKVDYGSGDKNDIPAISCDTGSCTLRWRDRIIL